MTNNSHLIGTRIFTGHLTFQAGLKIVMERQEKKKPLK